MTYRLIFTSPGPIESPNGSQVPDMYPSSKMAHILGSQTLGGSFIRFIKNTLLFSLGSSKFRFYTASKNQGSYHASVQGFKKSFSFTERTGCHLYQDVVEAVHDPCLKAVSQHSCLQGMREKKAFLHPTRHKTYALQHMSYRFCDAV